MNDLKETKNKTIKVAIALFATKGFKGTSIREISRAMDMSISNIYHYFGNKEGLMLAILEQSSKVTASNGLLKDTLACLKITGKRPRSFFLMRNIFPREAMRLTGKCSGKFWRSI